MKYVKAIQPEPVPVQHEVLLTDQEIRTLRKIVGKLGGPNYKHNIALDLDEEDTAAAASLFDALYGKF